MFLTILKTNLDRTNGCAFSALAAQTPDFETKHQHGKLWVINHLLICYTGSFIITGDVSHGTKTTPSSNPSFSTSTKGWPGRSLSKNVYLLQVFQTFNSCPIKILLRGVAPHLQVNLINLNQPLHLFLVQQREKSLGGRQSILSVSIAAVLCFMDFLQRPPLLLLIMS